jgi:ankyrin repeat protein
LRLLDRGADIDMQDNMGWTALMLAADNGNEELAAQLLGRGAGLHQQQYHMKKNAREIAEAKAAEGGDAQLNAARLRIAALIHQEQSARAARPFTRGTDKPLAVRRPVRLRK